MYSTAKEVHVYIDGATQVLSSNRKQSIAPQLLDMILNDAVIEYISSRFPNGYNQKDIESTLKRYTDFSVLKSTFRSIPYIFETSLYPAIKCVKPHNSVKIQSVVCSYRRPFQNTDISTNIKSSILLKISDAIVNESNAVITLEFATANSSKIVILNLADVLAEVKTTSGAFYLYNYIVDCLSNIHKLNVRYSSTNENGTRSILIEPSVGDSIVRAEASSTNIVCSINTENVKCPTKSTGSVSPCSLHQDGDALRARHDFYSSKNSHLDPITEVEDDGLVIYYTDFLPMDVAINYLRRPKLFDIRTGQIPEINITKEFLDFAVKFVFLTISNPNYTQVVNETIKNS